MALLLALFFEFWRSALLFLINADSSAIPVGVMFKSFLVGFRFDFAIACYITIPLIVPALLPSIGITKAGRAKYVYLSIISVAAAVTFFIHLADIEFFDYFNTRLNSSALNWQDTPGMMLSLVWETYPVIRYLLFYGAVLFVFIYLLDRIQNWLLVKDRNKPFWLHLIWLPIIALTLFIGARGRIVDKTALRWGVAYFSQYDLANQLALNPTYTFLYDLYSADKKEDLHQFIEEIKRPDAEQTVRAMLGIPYDSTLEEQPKLVRHVRFDSTATNPPNLILIIMESFGATKIDIMNNIHGVPLSPNFDTLVTRGLLYTNLYSEGSHTYSGILSSLFGYPHILGKLLMKQVRGQYHLWGLGDILRKNDYQTIFSLTHDPHFDNIQGFVRSQGFERVLSSLDYPEDEYISTWGVPDHVMFDRLLSEIDQIKDDRFFITCLTASNHGPWLVPEVPFERVPAGTPDEEILNAFKYSDWAMCRFVNAVLADTTLGPTVIMIGSDNGAGGIRRMDMDLSYFHMPLLILDNYNHIPHGATDDQIGSQMDILSTAMGLLQLDYDNYSFGRDLRDTAATMERFAYLSEWYRVGIVQDDYYFLARLRGRGPKSIYAVDSLEVDLSGEMPDRLAEYERRALSMLQMAFYNVLRPLPTDIHDQRLGAP